MNNPYGIGTIEPEIFSFRGLNDIEHEMKGIDGHVDFKKEYSGLNYKYGLSQRSGGSGYNDDKIKSLENQIKELKDIMLYQFSKKDDIAGAVKENRETKANKAASSERIKKSVKSIPQPKAVVDTTDSLKTKAKQLETHLAELNNQIYFNYVCEYDDEYIIAQIEKWKNKSEYLMSLYPNTVADLKRQIFSQNLEFQTNIEATKENNDQILYNLDGAYKSLLDQTEYDIQELLNEREALETKTKEIKKVLRINK
jgi:hypothetical protein